MAIPLKQSVCNIPVPDTSPGTLLGHFKLQLALPDGFFIADAFRNVDDIYEALCATLNHNTGNLNIYG